MANCKAETKPWQVILPWYPVSVDSSQCPQTFTGFVFLDLVSAVQNRGLTCGLFDNRMLVLTCSISFSVQILLIYFPPLQSVFQTESLSLRDLGVLLALAGTSALLHEIRRRVEKAQAAKVAKVE